ncbi:hypothetical protein G6F56_007427 [Rhizopus delemar]|nr:hypothetical protein G6F56_007427 [Rhizopus delemar]
MSSQKQSSAPYSSSYSSGPHLGLSSISISRGPSYPGQESPVPRASTSSSSIAQPLISTSPRGSHHFQHGSPGSFSELERRRASSFGDAKQIKSYR